MGHGFYKVLSLATLVLLARYLGEREFGMFIVALVAVQLADAISDLGLSQAMVREGAGNDDRLGMDLAAVVPFKLVLSALSVILALGMVAASGGGALIVETAFYLGLAQALGSLTFLLRSVFQTHERMEYEALSVVLEGWLRLGAVVITVAGSYGLVGIGKMFALSSLIVVVATAIAMVHRFARPRFTTGWFKRGLDLLVMGLPISFVWLLIGADQRINTLLLARFSGDAAAGAFGAAFRLVEPTLIIPSMLIVAIFPVAVRHGREGVGTTHFLLTSSQKMLMALSLPIAAAIWVAAPTLVAIVFGSPIDSVIQPIRILAPVIVLLFARFGMTQMLLAAGRWRAALWPQVLALLANAALALVLIPMNGETGAALAVLGGEVIAVAAVAVVLRDDFGESGLWQIARPALIAIPSALAGGVVGQWSLALAVITTVAVYLVGLRLVRPFSRQDAAYLRSVMPMFAAAVVFATDERR